MAEQTDVAERQRVTAETAELISRGPEHARRLVTLPGDPAPTHPDLASHPQRP